ncbi:MAG: Haloacid dehalogenase-like hydrolase [Candidatus Carbobacillus altaicus]|uniref:Haloacid dehalogenase-like hydrolase n=1 Tax=Candidatus Carbonibacillus altaicus TaxID=2163959 RepID=A0A2R6Y025_9BACL|nr:MAG: Haloacid dehalogenase-like hydrolase [Candidatus Carbobacillus altaicus]
MKGREAIVLFDFDGTIADTGEMVLLSLLHVLDQVRPRVYTRGDLIDYLGLPLREQFARLAPEADADQLIRAYRAYQQTIFASHLRPVAGMREVLEALYARSVPMGIVTSRQRTSTEEGLRHLGWVHYFQTIVGFEDVRSHKPDPEPLYTALMRLGWHDRRCAPDGSYVPEDGPVVFYVGDQPVDMEAARSAGVQAVLVGWSMARPEVLLGLEVDARLTEPRALLDLLP